MCTPLPLFHMLNFKITAKTTNFDPFWIKKNAQKDAQNLCMSHAA